MRKRGISTGILFLVVGIVLINFAGIKMVYAVRTVEVISPNGGEKWIAGSTHNITWETSEPIGYINLFYSIDSGVTWRFIGNSLNTGKYEWKVPDVTTRHARVKIDWRPGEDTAPVSDASDEDFIIISKSIIHVAKPPGLWKIKRFYSDPPCYTKLPHKKNAITINATLECSSLSCEDLIIKTYWNSSIAYVVKKINLTKAVIDSCGPGASACTVMWNGEKVDVKIAPGKYSISKIEFISSRLTGDIKLTLEAYTGVKLSDKKTIIIRPCSAEKPRSQAKPDLVVERFQAPEIFTIKPGEKKADIKIILRVKNAGTVATRDFYVDAKFISYPGGKIVHSFRTHIPALVPGEVFTFPVFVRLAKGNYRVCVFIDSTDIVAESNEGNNKACRTFSVRGR